MSFDDVRLPMGIESGAAIGPMFSTNIISLSGGGEQRNADWDQERLQADISYGMMSKSNPNVTKNNFVDIMAFFRARRGRHRGFRFRDWSDYQAVAEPVVSRAGVADGKTFQLVKTYDAYVRRITRPVPETLEVFVGGVPVTTGWTLGPKGVLTFTSAPAGQVSASFEFDVPMRFDSDMQQVVLAWAQAGSIPSIKLVQIRE